MEKNYWENYYKKYPSEQHPSLFAESLLHNHIKKNDSLIELGCGNGRDALYFAHHKVKVLAIDQCEGEINFLEQNHRYPHLKFYAADFTSLDDIGFFNHVYSRFTLHTISQKEEDRVLMWAYNHLTEGGKFLIEARGFKNELYKMGNSIIGEEHAYRYNDHYRRFIDLERVKNSLINSGFKIEYAEEKQGFAPFGDTDQHFIRIIAMRK